MTHKEISTILRHLSNNTRKYDVSRGHISNAKKVFILPISTNKVGIIKYAVTVEIIK